MIFAYVGLYSLVGFVVSSLMFAIWGEDGPLELEDAVAYTAFWVFWPVVLVAGTLAGIGYVLSLGVVRFGKVLVSIYEGIPRK